MFVDDPLIGQPLFTIGTTPYYWFFKYLVWIALFGKYVPSLVMKSALPLLVWIVAMIGVSFANMKKPVKDYHGNASYAEFADIKKNGILPKNLVLFAVFKKLACSAKKH